MKWEFKTKGAIVTSLAVVPAASSTSRASTGIRTPIDQETGKEKWSFKSSRPIASSPAVDHGTLYFVSSVGALVALDLATGKPKWVFAAEHERKFEAKGLHGCPSRRADHPRRVWTSSRRRRRSPRGRSSSAAATGTFTRSIRRPGLLQWKFGTGDVVRVAGLLRQHGLRRELGQHPLRDRRADTGQARWSFKAGEDPCDPQPGRFPVRPRGGRRRTVCVGCRDAHVYALPDAATGTQEVGLPDEQVLGDRHRRRWPTARSHVGTLGQRRFMALDAKTGRLRFNFDAKAYVFLSRLPSRAIRSTSAITTEALRDLRVDGKARMGVPHRGLESRSAEGAEPGRSLNQDAFSPVFGDFEDT